MAKNKSLYFRFVDLETASERVPRWDIVGSDEAMVDKLLVKALQAMDRDSVSKVRASHGYSKEFGV